LTQWRKRRQEIICRRFLFTGTDRDVAGLIELFEKAGVDEFPRICGLGAGDAIAHVFENGFEAFQVRIGLDLHDLAQSLVSVFQLLFVRTLAVFDESALGRFGIGPNARCIHVKQEFWRCSS
jgi:hypothetical protein